MHVRKSGIEPTLKTSEGRRPGARVRIGRSLAAIALAAATIAAPAAAEVTRTSEIGFTSRNQVEVAAAPREIWTLVIEPGLWWSSGHTYSGDARNMTMDARPGGCFCETIPAASAAPAGAIEHMRVIYAAPGSTLRMTGGLGPLQSEAVTGVLTMTFEPVGESTKIVWEYTVGGYMRVPVETIAPLVDEVVGEQLRRLASLAETGSPAAH